MVERVLSTVWATVAPEMTRGPRWPVTTTVSTTVPSAASVPDDWAEAAPGKRWFYLNEGYVLLGEIIGRVSGQPYSEYIRDLIRREQERSAEIEAIRAALIEGEASGEPRRFDPAAFKQRMLTAHG